MVHVNRTAERRRWCAALGRAASVLVALVLGSCTAGNLSRFVVDTSTPAARMPERQAVEIPPQHQREHLRILAAYGGAYEDERLQSMLAATVDRLVTASERPD